MRGRAGLGRLGSDEHTLWLRPRSKGKLLALLVAIAWVEKRSIAWGFMPAVGGIALCIPSEVPSSRGRGYAKPCTIRTFTCKLRPRASPGTTGIVWIAIGRNGSAEVAEGSGCRQLRPVSRSAGDLGGVFQGL